MTWLPATDSPLRQAPRATLSRGADFESILVVFDQSWPKTSKNEQKSTPKSTLKRGAWPERWGVLWLDGKVIILKDRPWTNLSFWSEIWGSQGVGVDPVTVAQNETASAVWSEKVFVSQERVSGLPEKGADLRGSPGTSGEVWGTSGEVWETSGEPPDCC